MLLFSLVVKAQDPCEWAANVSDSIGQYKATKNYLMHERNFAGTLSSVYFSLALTDGLPTLNVQMIQRGKDFLKADCFDKNSRMFLQLENGKIVTLLHIDQENCATGVRNEEVNNRILAGYFLFPKDAIETLQSSPVSLMRIRFSTGTTDYIIRESFVSETENKTYSPARYFMSALPCLEK